MDDTGDGATAQARGATHSNRDFSAGHAVEARIAALFNEAFDRGDIGAEDDFFGLGGDSLLAEALIARIERNFGVILPVSIVLEAPTARLLAGQILAVGHARKAGGLIRVRTAGSGSPLFCIHGMDGETTFCHRLDDLLPAGRPIYGLRAYGLLRDEIPIRTVVRMASSYLAEIRSVQPTGPYLILGQCGAAVVAYEIAQQLSAAGETVAGLILADPTVSELPWLTASGMDLVLKKAEIVERAERNVDDDFLDRSLNGEQRRKLIYKVMYGVVAGYAPKPYAGDVLMANIPHHARALMDRKKGFAALAPKLKNVEIRGDHRELFNENAPQFVQAIIEFLDRVAPLGGRGNGAADAVYE